RPTEERMKIRSITCFYDPGASKAAQTLASFYQMTSKARKAFEEIGLEVQTVRAATPPFPEMIPSCCDDSAIHMVKTLEGEASALGFDYISFGPALPSFPESYRLIPQMIAATRNAFFSGIMATRQDGVIFPAVRACAGVIEQCANIQPNGFANLRFTALANVPPFGPFFPAAYHQSGSGPAFGLAIECADDAVQAFRQADSLSECRRLLLERLESAAARMQTVCERMALEYRCDFKGFDFSLAPFPTDDVSLGGAIESLGIPSIGLPGSVAAAAFVADTLDRGNWKRCGFNGLMLPVLEDSVLARRTVDGTLTVRDLLLFSTVCGTGLDTVPLPGDATQEALAALLADVSALAVRLGKPLTARLMPVPGKSAGEMTTFDFGFFSNGKILDLPASKLSGKLGGDESMMLTPRQTS
ncbi:MAG: DUF711 family protein, partial [Anaerolineaceae bacterium]|nr:DUF711 family protein [Anaerolineaceae bacterium]